MRKENIAGINVKELSHGRLWPRIGTNQYLTPQVLNKLIEALFRALSMLVMKEIRHNLAG
jgi:hypothetical protein